MRRWTKRLLILLAVLVLPAAAFYLNARWQAERELREALAELDANEAPWRWEDLIAARPQLHEQDDAHTVMVNARQLAPGFFGKFTFYEKALAGPPHRVIDPQDAGEFHELMKATEPALAEARKINQMPAGRFQIAWGNDIFAANYNEIQKARSFMDLLQCAAAWRAHQGDLDAAIDDCRVMQRACQSLEDEPTLIVHLVRIAMQAVSMQALERVLAQGQPSPGHLEQLQRDWERFDQDRAMLKCLRGERAFAHRWYEQLAKGKMSFQVATGGPKGTQVSFWDRLQGIYLMANLNQSHAWSLRHWNDILKTMELPEPERTQRQRELDKLPATAPTVARMTTPAVQKVLEAHRRALTSTGSAVTALAAERFRCEHERWPKSLAELCPKFLAKVPDDLYSGKPLQLRPTADGIVIYSVGPDGKHGGMYLENKAAKAVSNIKYEFRLWDVAHRRKTLVRQP